VFDISQTEGNELPTLTEVQGEVSGYRERLVKFVEARGGSSPRTTKLYEQRDDEPRSMNTSELRLEPEI
jgi:hypothetical protein